MSQDKPKSVNIADYLLAKDGKTKYLKIQCSPKADDKTKKLVADLIALLGTDVLYVNLFDEDFRAKFNIPDFSKGRISLPTTEQKSTGSSKKDDGGVNF